MRHLLLSGLLAATALGGFGCDDDDGDVQETEARLGCDRACEVWEACVGPQFGITDCIDQCEDNLDEGLVNEAEVEGCSRCLNQWVCIGPNPCTDQCLGVIF